MGVDEGQIEGTSKETILGHKTFAVLAGSSLIYRRRRVNVAAIQGAQAASEEWPEFGAVAKYWRRWVTHHWQAHMFLVELIGGDGKKDLSEVAIDVISTSS